VVDKTIAKTLAHTEIASAQILRVEWNAPENLTVSGGDVWHDLKLESRLSLPDADGPQIDGRGSHDFKLSAEPAFTKHDNVTAYAVGQWDRAPTGESVAAAIEQMYEAGDMDGKICILQEGKQVQLAETPNVVLALKWDTSSTKLLAIWDSNLGDKSFITIWDANSAHPTGRIVSRKPVRESVWLDDNSFACCGDNVLSIYNVQEESFQHQRDIETDRPWEQLHYDVGTGMIVCTSQNDGELGLLDVKEHVLQTKNAHDDSITSVQWQPVAEARQAINDSNTRMLATSCADGTVKLWNARQALECVHTFTPEPCLPVWTVQFSSDGSMLAAVMDNEIRVWETKVDGALLARWTNQEIESRQPDGGHEVQQRDSTGGNNDVDGEEETQEPTGPTYALTWSPSNQRLALTHGCNVWIIEMPNATESKT
ncbi:MAG: hypothetical protein Q9159_006687, partial [Coniocarpon cinnabarinum]